MDEINYEIIKRLRKELDEKSSRLIRVYEKAGPIRQVLIEADVCVGLLVSCVKNGEDWKPEYEKALEDYRSARNTLQQEEGRGTG